jgi:6-phosphogluconolactonase (cycloisomerase 2 family)
MVRAIDDTVKNRLLGGLSRSAFRIAVGAVLSGVAACGGTGNGFGTMHGTIQSLQITPASVEATTGQSVQLTATALYSDGAHVDVTGQASWTSSNNTVATAASGGQVGALSAGFAAIHATLSGVEALAQLTVAKSGGGLPSGYAYIASADVNNRALPGAVYQYSIGSDGSVAPLSVASVPAGVNPEVIVSDPSGRYVYVANGGDNTISQYAVGAGGGLVALSPAVVGIATPYPFAGYAVSIDPRGRFLYVVGLPHDPAGPSAPITQYSIQNDGTLAPPAPQVNLPVFARGPLAFDPSGQYAYLPSATNAPGGLVSQFSINSDGTLTPLMSATVAASRGTIGVTIAPSGQTAYVISVCIDAACDGQIEPYMIGANGTLTPTGVATPTSGHVNPVASVTDGSGSSVYLLANAMGVDTNAGAVYQYAVDNTGALMADTPASLSVASGAVAESTYGPNLYVLSANAIGFVSGLPPGGHIDHYVIGSGGLLTAVSATTVAASLPTSMTLVVAH